MTWAPDYVTTAELKSYLRISDTDDDTLLAFWITSASRAVDEHCGRQFGLVGSTEVREYTPVYDSHLRTYVTEIDDLAADTSLIVLDADAVEIDEYTLQPVNALLKGKPYERIYFDTCTASVTLSSAKWGWTAVPSAAKVATMLQSARLAARRDSPYGIAGSPSEGSEMRLLATLDPDLKTMLGAFRRDWWAA